MSNGAARGATTFSRRRTVRFGCLDQAGEHLGAGRQRHRLLGDRLLATHVATDAGMGLKTVIPGESDQDHHQRQGRRDARWIMTTASSRRQGRTISDCTYVATWSGFVYVAFVIDSYGAGS